MVACEDAKIFFFPTVTDLGLMCDSKIGGLILFVPPKKSYEKVYTVQTLIGRFLV